MDGLEEAKVYIINKQELHRFYKMVLISFCFEGILVLAATNRPYAIDAALMRPGRFDLVSTHTGSLLNRRVLKSQKLDLLCLCLGDVRSTA